MARKNLDEKDKRVVQVNIRLTRDEFEKISGYACASDLTPANLDPEESLFRQVSHGQVVTHRNSHRTGTQEDWR